MRRSFIRKPSLKKSFKARTTGRAKRSIKRAINPAYGKKGIGALKNPKRSAYNAVYHKTSINTIPSSSPAEETTTNNDDGCGCGCILLTILLIIILIILL